MLQRDVFNPILGKKFHIELSSNEQVCIQILTGVEVNFFATFFDFEGVIVSLHIAVISRCLHAYNSTTIFFQRSRSFRAQNIWVGSLYLESSYTGGQPT